MNVGEQAGVESGSQTTAAVGFFFQEELNSSEDREHGGLTLVSFALFASWVVAVCCRDKDCLRQGLGHESCLNKGGDQSNEEAQEDHWLIPGARMAGDGTVQSSNIKEQNGINRLSNTAFFSFVVLDVEPKVFDTLDNHSTTELLLQVFSLILPAEKLSLNFYGSPQLTLQLIQALNCQSSCLSHWSIGNGKPESSETSRLLTEQQKYQKETKFCPVLDSLILRKMPKGALVDGLWRSLTVKIQISSENSRTPDSPVGVVSRVDKSQKP